MSVTNEKETFIKNLDDEHVVVVIDNPEFGIVLKVVPKNWASKHDIKDYGINNYHKIPNDVQIQLESFPELKTENYFFIE